jgi:hypothetical protein
MQQAYRRTFGRERAGDRGADAAASPGDQRDAALQLAP